MNPCRCGYFGDVNRSCNKVPRCKQEYQSKISGPLLDRIDLHTEVPYVNLLSIQKSDMISEDTATVKKRIIAAREMQSKRYKDKSFKINSDLNGEDLIKFVHFDHKIKELLQKLIEERSLSPRGYSRLLKVARTIADLNGSEEVLREHFLEALVYRPN